MSSPQFTNRLANESSLYLKQHQHNPVDWFPWGEEALALARERDVPIFLSIGYSACHWCHVMEHESFENQEIATFLNQHFISIKVDREERPDLDQIYMTAVQILNNGQGGWPMTVFLTPDLRPFTGGTYFPPDDNPQMNRPGFKRVIASVNEWWRTKRSDIDNAARQITESLEKVRMVPDEDPRLDTPVLEKASDALATTFDPNHGGFGPAPKFPHPMDVRLLFRVWKRFGNAQALHMARFTLEGMANGGIYDHLGGGFARYSTDNNWLVPHFEKMLYDNALLVPCYLEAYQISKKPQFREVVEETFAWLEREMTSKEGPFYSSQDADTEGVEGKYYVWSEEEIREHLGEGADLFCAAYGVTPSGNWEGSNILNRVKSDEQLAKAYNLPVEEIGTSLRDSRQSLLDVRSNRTQPAIDTKVLTSWNGMMIDALARGAQVLDEPKYATMAAKAAEFILRKIRTPQGRLLRTWSSGSEPKYLAYLEDYAFLCEGLTSLFEATGEPRWLLSASTYAKAMVTLFWDETRGGFFYSGHDQENLICRTKELHDQSIPSGNAVAAQVFLQLAKLTGDSFFQEHAEKTLRLSSPLLTQHSLAMGGMLKALDFYIGPLKELVVTGNEDGAIDSVLRCIHSSFRPHRVLAFRRGAPPEQELVPLLAGKEREGPVTTYVCENFACHQPLEGVAEAEQFLGKS